MQTDTTLSSTPDVATQQENEGDTSKLPVVPASPLPALRTRRMHPQSSISAVPPDPWLSTTPEHVDLQTPTRTTPGRQTPRPQARPFPARIFSVTPPPANSASATSDHTEIENAQPDFPDFEDVETFEDAGTDSSQVDFEKAETGADAETDSVRPELEETAIFSDAETDSAQPEAEEATIFADAETDSAQPESEKAATFAETEIPAATPSSQSIEEPPIEMLDTISLPAQPGEKPHGEVVPAEEPPIEMLVTGALPVSEPGSFSTLAGEKETYAAPASPPSTPSVTRPSPWNTAEPATPSPWPAAATPVETPHAQLPSTPTGTGRGKYAGKKRKNILLVTLVIALVVLVGASAFAFRQQIFSGTTTPQASPTSAQQVVTHLTFSGAVAGPVSEITPVSCRDAAAGDLRTLTVTLSGTVHNQLYNFGFVIGHYNGPGTYTNPAASLTILLNLPGESTTNGWGNTDPADSGSITIDHGGQTGSITYTLSGFGKQASTQIQIAGTWACNN